MAIRSWGADPPDEDQALRSPLTPTQETPAMPTTVTRTRTYRRMEEARRRHPRDTTAELRHRLGGPPPPAETTDQLRARLRREDRRRMFGRR